MSKMEFGCVGHLRWIRKHMAQQDDEHKVKTCPWCGHEAKAKVVDGETLYNCLNIDCPTGHWTPLKVWNTRPIEGALTARIAELEAENERLSQLLHDEMSQLEIATDLGNKRWAALNKIYEDGEKHNANWCKRMAQEGLGIKNA